MGVERLRLAIVGCGSVARYMALLARLNPRITLAACCDLAQERAEKFARRFAIPAAYQSYERLLEQPGIDALYLAVPHDLHFAMSAAAIERRLPLLLEKPITAQLEQGLRLVEMAAAAGVKVGVNYQYRYDRGIYALAQAMQSGALGKIHLIRCRLAWRREARYFSEAPWHASQARAGGGTLITQGSHLLDAALWALGEAPASALGYTAQRRFATEVEDLAEAVIETENGTPLQIGSSMATSHTQPLQMEVFGEETLAIYRDQPFPHVRFHGRRLRRAAPPLPGLHALQRSLEGFRRWIADDAAYLIPAASALPVLAAVEAIYHSAASGQRQPIRRLPELQG